MAAQSKPDGSDRRLYLGGSDAAAALGVSPWRSTFRLWSEKVGADPIPDLSLNSWIEWGIILEPVVAKKFAALNPAFKVFSEPRFLTHKKYPFMGGHIDRRVITNLDARSMLECKTANAFDYRMWGPDEGGIEAVPPHYVAQVDHYMAIMDIAFCYIAVLIGGSDYRSYHIARSKQRERELIAAESDLWDRIVREDPPPIHSEADARLRWKSALEGLSKEVDIVGRDKVVALGQVIERRKTIDAQEKALRNDIFPVFEDRESLAYNGKVIARLSTYTRTGFNLDGFRAKYKKIAAKFETKTPTKSLNILI